LEHPSYVMNIYSVWWSIPVLDNVPRRHKLFTYIKLSCWW